MTEKSKQKLNEMWADEYVNYFKGYKRYIDDLGKGHNESKPLRKRSLPMYSLEKLVNFARFELLYPKLSTGYHLGGMESTFPKGFLYSAIANTLIGAYIGGEKDFVAGGAIGFWITALQAVFGMGIRGITYTIRNSNKNKRTITSE